ncbi:hypothetical protein [Pontiella sp.]|uniref:hypothetical protein n=1 Tax=Pontiella sp. TaxID=2837462 RepID=UPI0035654617
MKITASFLSLLMAASFLSGCSSFQPTDNQADEFDEETAEQSAYFREGGMDRQVESWKKPGGRY